MTTDLAVLVPVLRRPHRVRPLLDTFRAATPGTPRVVFICDPDDEPEREAVAEAGGEELVVSGGYATKVNAAVAVTDEPLIFLAADDIHPEPGWLDAANAELQGEIGVVGVNDLISRRPGREGHATHFLMARWYAVLPTIDGSCGPLCEAYTHSFVDDELIATATRRGAYTYAPNAHVRHEHPMNGTADDDDTYRKGRQHFRDDRRLFQRRSRLWR